MDIENKIFQKYFANFDKLLDYGFTKNKKVLKYEKFFQNNLFKAVIGVDFNGKITGMVYDIENNDEFLPLKAEHNQGRFVSEIREKYKEILKDIRDNCFTEEYFIYPQSKRIAKNIIEKYEDKPEFLWDKFKGSGVFRNKKTNKWYALILYIDKNKLIPNKTEYIEVLDIKLSSNNVQKYLEYKNFYPAYHMNKKHWITIILDDSIEDNKIMELIEESYNYTRK